MNFRNAQIIRTLFTFSLLLLIATIALAQSGVVSKQRGTGTITGRVVSTDGQPIPHASINISGAGGIRTFRGQMIRSDEEGNFVIDGLDPMPYFITARAPGYVILSGDDESNESGVVANRYYRVGDNVTLRLMRGGVITGRVTNASGEPVIGVGVRPIRLRDAKGKTTSELGFTRLNTTDDRGIYRIYGLAPGSYIVMAAGGGIGGRSPFGGKSPVFHPSSTRETATVVQIRGGEEITNVDINWRPQAGHSISGKITGAPATEMSGGMGISVSVVQLRLPGSNTNVASSIVMPMDNSGAYGLYGVPDGEYEIQATRGNGEDSSLASPPKRVTVKGADLSGIDLALAPLASVSGTVKLETVSSETKMKCQSRREPLLSETMVSVQRDEAGASTEIAGGIFGFSNGGMIDDKGGFAIKSLKAGQYRLTVNFPDDTWYLKSVTASSTASRTAAAAIDAGRAGFAVKSGERLQGLTATLAEGAAGITGKLQGAKPAGEWRVYLIPAEKESVEDVLRYYEASITGAGEFRFGNIAPGKYLITMRAVTAEAGAENNPRPLIWIAAERLRLRRAAESTNKAIELSACQRIHDFPLSLRDFPLPLRDFPLPLR
jgi:hypothetical protein